MDVSQGSHAIGSPQCPSLPICTMVYAGIPWMYSQESHAIGSPECPSLPICTIVYAGIPWTYPKDPMPLVVHSVRPYQSVPWCMLESHGHIPRIPCHW